MPLEPGSLVISLDFELMWGVRDHTTVADYRENLLGVRRAIPAILELFDRHEIHATWATVGLLFCESRAEALAFSPAVRPRYRDTRLSPYEYLERVVGNDERDDPFHFAPSLIREILRHPNQEIGTHTFSHYYCLEPDQYTDAFRADLATASKLANKFDVKLQSIVFPRNQVHDDYLPACREAGLRAFRGNPAAWLYAERRGDEETLVRRGMRLLDAYVPLSRPDASTPRTDIRALTNVPATRFLRPYSRRLAALEPQRKRRILSELESAARERRTYHLWWHPHNFGANTDENIAFLSGFLKHFDAVRRDTGMQSRAMLEATGAA